ncbi:cytochrome P450 [Penicillium cf. griseofulvum]|nr:cytochrome P450 [Penicillium cf. griseofulvum]
MSQVVLPLLAISSGALLHLMLYRFNEWDTEAPYVFLSHLIFWISGSMLIYFKQSSMIDIFDIRITPKGLLVLGNYSTLGIYCSVILYRMFFHKLRKFPGPFLARASNFYIIAISGKKLRFYLESQRLHRIHGDYLRIGPSELSIADPRAVRAIYGSQSPVSKGPFYTMLHPQKALLTTREKQEHAERRNVWDKAFSSKGNLNTLSKAQSVKEITYIPALHDYEPRMLILINRLLEIIDNNLDKPVPVKEWLNYLAFDVMGDIVLGKSFNTLTDDHAPELHIVNSIKVQLRVAFGYFVHLPWLFSFLKVIPLVNSGTIGFWRWIDSRILETHMVSLHSSLCDNLDTTSMRTLTDTYNSSDWINRTCYHISFGPMRGVERQLRILSTYKAILLGALLRGGKSIPHPLNFLGQKQRETRFPSLDFAKINSNPIATAALNILFRLACHKDQARKLQKRLDELPNLSYDSVLKLDLLDGVINEAFRLHSPLLSGSQRLTPPNGLYIGDEYIPGNVKVRILMLSTDSRVFVSPEEFIPERWTTRPELIKDHSVFIPFNTGEFC